MEILVVLLVILGIVLFYRSLPGKISTNNIKIFFAIDRIDIVLILIGFLSALSLYWPILARIPNDQRLLQLFSPDFSIQVALIQEMVERGSFDLNIPAKLQDTDPFSTLNHWRFGYGALHINLTILLSRCLSFVTPLSYATMAKIHAGLLLLGLMVSMNLLYLWGRSIRGKILGFAAILIYLLPYKVMFLVIHACSPDHIQQVFMLSSLLACAFLYKEGDLKVLFLAAFLAGLAFGTKYAGIFLLPLIAMIPLVRKDSKLNFLTTVKIIVITGFTFFAGFAVLNPQALLHPIFFAESFLNLSKTLNYEYLFNNGLFKTYQNLFYEQFLHFDKPLVTLTLVGGLLFVLRVFLNRALLGSIFGSIFLIWGIFYTVLLVLVLRYAESGIFIPIWPVITLLIAFGITESGKIFTQFFYFNSRGLSASISIIILISILSHEFLSNRSAFFPVKTDRPLLFNLYHPFYMGVRELSEFLTVHYPRKTKIMVDYTQIYVPIGFKHVSYVSYVFIGNFPQSVLNSHDIFILSRSDTEFETAIREGYYDVPLLSQSREIYRNIRTSYTFTKVEEFDYPSGWLNSKVEVWERVSR